MGISGALVTSGNTIDLALEKLRNAVKAKQRRQDRRRAGARPGADRRREGARPPDRLGAAGRPQERQGGARREGDRSRATPQAVTRAASDEFWQRLRQGSASTALEFLENRIASQAADADLLFLNYVGTDFQAFQKSFDRMKIVEGTMVPPGKRGFLFAKHVYEEQLKLKAARRLDKIKEGDRVAGRDDRHRPRPAAHGAREHRAGARDPAAARRAEDGRLPRQAAARARQPARPTSASCWPRSSRPTTRTSTSATTSSTRSWRRRWSSIGCAIGDVLTIKAFTRSGYVQSVNVPVYGTFQFQGLEKSTLAGALNLMDMVSFRELYGFMSGEKLAEIQALQKEAGAHDVSRENAEAELFGKRRRAPRRRRRPRRRGTSRRPPRRASPPVMHDLGESLGGKLQREEARSRVFPAGEVEQGVVLNAAVILKDPKKIKRDHRGDRGAGEARRADAQGDRLAEGRRASSASSSTSSGSCSTWRS